MHYRLSIKFVWLICLLPLTAFALTPPWSEAELHEAAELVVEGELRGPIQCAGPVEPGECADRLRFVAPLLVQKVVHRTVGPIAKSIKLYFWHNDYHGDCVGDQGSDNYVGEQGVYYLRRYQDGWTPLHWSAVQRSKDGSGERPHCAAARKRSTPATIDGSTGTGEPAS